jgi:hypothetical protein
MRKFERFRAAKLTQRFQLAGNLLHCKSTVGAMIDGAFVDRLIFGA